MTLAELNQHIVSSTESLLGHNEAVATARLLLEDILGVDRTTLLSRGDRPVEPETETRFQKIIERILAGEPPQYIVGKARFMGMDFKVNRSTLIPRPETAELVDLVLDNVDRSKNLRILDVGTGSGCIAIALARALGRADVTAVDVSSDALAVAAANGRRLGVNVDFMPLDILDIPAYLDDNFDIIVSNPPYISEKERADMEPRVKNFEPSSALFVPDDDPLLFYRAIADFSRKSTLFFEINPLYADDLRAMLTNRGYECDILRDSFGKLRFAIARHQS